MKLQIVRADPAGNITVFVKTLIAPGLYAPVAEKLLAVSRLKAEQVAFCTEAAPGLDGAIEMAGGEFCGNAARSYGLLLARERGAKETGKFRISVSGCQSPVSIEANPMQSTAAAQMPLPKLVRSVRVGMADCTLVHLGGIVHLVAEDTEPSLEFFKQAEPVFTSLGSLDAYGVMFLDGEKLTPLVKVPSVRSLYWEGSCGSGSAAVAIARCLAGKEDIYSATLHQPAGDIFVQTEKKNREVVRVRIGGMVKMDDEEEINIEI